VRRSLIFALTLLGLFDSLYLLWVYASPAHAMVCLGSGCDEVRASRFAHFLGLPTPLFGVAMYGLLAVLIFAEPLAAAAQGAWLRRAIAILAGAGVIASAALTAIEAWVIHAWCAWCVVQAAAVGLILILSVTLLRAAADRAALRRHALLLVVAIAAGTPAFVWLTRHAEARAKEAEAPPPTASDIAGKLVRPDSHATGNPQAAVTLVEFGDLQCPSCAASEPEMRQLRRRYGNRVRFVFRQFPLEKLHAYALNAAQASECAAQQGKFWEALERFYAANGDLSDKSLERYAGELGLDTAKFHACFTSGATLATIRRDFEDGRALGVRGTPTFFLGRQRILGAPELAKFEQLLNAELSLFGGVSAGTTPAPPTGAPPKTGKKPPPQKSNGSSSASGNPFGSGSFLNLQGSSIDCTEDAPKGPEPAMIHTAEAEKLFHDGSVFVDVRSADDYHKARIAGAVNLPLIEAERRASELPRDKTIVLYEGGSGGPSDACAASRTVGRVLLARGYTKVVIYQDGLTGWEKQSLPTER
jgi:protein-disulfide isomerase/rhodanese-related sulfurtransferase